MSKWETASKETSGAGGSGDFVKLGDGESIVLALLGEPENYRAKPFNAGDAPGKKVLLNAFDVTAKKRVVWDMAAATFQSLLEVSGTPDKPGKFPLARWTFTIKRKGTGPKTKYTILPEKELVDAQKQFLAKVELADLEALADRIAFRPGEQQQQPQARQSYQRPADPAPQQSMQAAMGVDESQLPF